MCLGVVCGLNVLYIDTPRLLGWGACGAFLHNAEHATADGASLNSRRSTTTRPPAPCRLAQRGEDPLAVALGNGVGDVEETGLVDHVHLPYGIHLSVKSETLPHVVIILLSRLGLHPLHYSTRKSSPTAESPGRPPRSRSVKTRPSPRPPLPPAVCPLSYSASRALAPGYVSSTKSSAKTRPTSPAASLSRLGGCTPRRGFWRRCAGFSNLSKRRRVTGNTQDLEDYVGIVQGLLGLSCGCPRHYAKPAEASSAGRQAAYAASLGR